MEIDTMDLIIAMQITCLVMFIWHRYVRPIKWIVEIDLGILRVILPVLVIGGMIWGIVDRKPYDYGLSWEEKDKARSIALKLSIKEQEQSKGTVPQNIDPSRKPKTEYSIPLQNLLEGNHGRFL